MKHATVLYVVHIEALPLKFCTFCGTAEALHECWLCS